MGQVDDHDVARTGDHVAEQHFHDPELDFTLGRSVDGRVAPRPEHPQELTFFPAQDAPFHETVDSRLPRVVGTVYGVLDPVPRPVRFG